MEKKIWENILKIKDASPLVHNITNYVVMNSSANTLLAAGASPVMAHSPDEVSDMVKIANALVINIGTLSEPWVRAMTMALKEANQQGIPVILDPVGAGATPYRSETVNKLLGAGSFTVIRGNASEIMAVLSAEYQTKGVDSTQSADNAVDSARILSREHRNVISVSGKTDFVVSGNQLAEIHNGHEWMPRITGMGCAATALTGAFAAVNKDYFEAAVSAMALMGVAGELAAPLSAGPGTLQINFFDLLYNLEEEEFLETVKINILNHE